MMLMPILVRVETQVPWKAWRGPSGEWVATCDALRLTAGGTTWNDLIANCADAIRLLMEDLADIGEVAEFLHAHGWKSQPPIPARQAPADVQVDLPWMVEVARGGGG